MEVEPIRDMFNIRLMSETLLEQGQVRESAAFRCGCNCALRVSDLLELKVSDLDKGKVAIKERKTGKIKHLVFNDNFQLAALESVQWIRKQGIEPVYVFQATGNRAKALVKPISTRHMSRTLKDTSLALGLTENVGTHTMRKSWAYHAYHNGLDFRMIQRMLNHSSEAETLCYIGLTRQRMEEAYHDYAIDF